VRLRSDQFAQARDLLRRASQSGSAKRWADALRSAEFYATLGEARAALDSGNLSNAQRIAEPLARSNSDQPALAFELLAAIYEKQGRYMEAAEMSQKAAQQPDATEAMARQQKVNALRQRALAAWQAGDDVGAESLFQQGLLTDSSDPWIRYEFARFMDDRGRIAETESLIRSLAQMSTAEAHYAAALLLERLDRPAEAEGLMAKIPASELSAEMKMFVAGLQIDTAIDRARVIAIRGQTTQATAGLRQIGSASHVSAEKMGEIASALYELGDTAGAGDLARRALEKQPNDMASYEPIIRVLAQTGQEAFALSALQRVSDTSGNNPQAAQMLGRLSGIIAAIQSDQMREKGRYAESFDLLQSAWNGSPGNVEILSALGRLYQSGGLSMQAAQTYQLVLQQKPEDMGAMIGLIDSAAAVGDRKLAERTLRSALQRYPEEYEVYLAGARQAQTGGDDRRARDYLQQARELYLRKSGLASGGFPAANPFANMRSAKASDLASVNPFALGTNPKLGDRIGASLSPVPDSAFATNSIGTRQITVSSAYENSPKSAFSGSSIPGFAAMADSVGVPASSGDPVLDAIQRDLQQLAVESGPRVEVHTNFRDRSGETGLSALQEVGAKAEISTDFDGGRISAGAHAVVVDAGQPTGSGLARFGRNGTSEAQAIVDEVESDLANADTQHASGIALSVGYRDDLIEGDVGTTPLGFKKTDFAGGIAVRPRFSPYASGRIWAERRPVTDSVVSYAGTEDPVAGEYWGGVMRSGLGASFSWDREGTGFYGEGRYSRYSGTNVRDNESIQINLGGYFRAYEDETSKLTVGVNANYQAYDNNQNYFTFGHGGYFSPQSFLSISFPVRYAYRKDALEIDGSVTPGYQSYEQDGEALYPTDADAQSALDALKLLNSDVRARYDTISQTGFGFAADGSAYYRVSPRTRIGGEFQYNTFGDYNEFQTLFGVRQAIGGSD